MNEDYKKLVKFNHISEEIISEKTSDLNLLIKDNAMLREELKKYSDLYEQAKSKNYDQSD